MVHLYATCFIVVLNILEISHVTEVPLIMIRNSFSFTAHFRGDQEHADKYFDKLQALLVNDDTG